MLALTPSTNPVSTVYFKILLALLTRNAVVLSPHPFAKECCADAARVLGEAAVAAGAPDGVVQVVEEPSVPLIDALMTDERTDVILATGGVAVVRAAYSSGNPAIGVGPGNVPVLVDATADLAARRGEAGRPARRSTTRSSAPTRACSSSRRRSPTGSSREMSAARRPPAGRPTSATGCATRSSPAGRFDTSHGRQGRGRRSPPRPASGCRRAPGSCVAPFDLAVDEEPLAHEKLCPVLGVRPRARAPRAASARRSAVLRIGGAGHSAVIHSNDPRTVMDYAAAVDVLRVTVNEGGSTGSAGFGTNLAPSMTIGTGFVGRSSLGENLEPQAPGQLTRIAYSTDPTRGRCRRSTGIDPVGGAAGRRAAVPAWRATAAAAPPADRLPSPTGARQRRRPSELREELRRLIIEELDDDHQGLRTAVTAELRSFIFLDQLQPQTMCYLGTWIKGSLPRADMAAQIIEVAPGLDIEPLTDVALKNTDVQAGILVVERQFGYLEIHSRVDRGGAVRERGGARRPRRAGLGRDAARRSSPRGSCRASTRSTRS